MATIHHTARRSPNRRSLPGQPPERPRDADERRLREEHILDAASDLLVRFGYRKTTIDDVAREAGVGKGTIYLHWQDKNELFRAAIWREQERFTEEVKQRIAADPEGGLLHRAVAHGMLATLSSPLMAAMFTGKSDIYNGVLGAYDQSYINQLVTDTNTYLVQLQDSGLIRRDLPVPLITYLITALKVGIIYLPDVVGQQQAPSIEELAESLSDLIRRWLEPEDLPRDSQAGKRSFNELMGKIKEPT
ncbi:MAG: TetR/AcrR family transcriptional regulator [Ktedonobacterales bacterium]